MANVFAKLMGNMKELEIELEKVSNELDENFNNYLEINKQINQILSNLLEAATDLDEKKFHQIKKQLHDSIFTFKKELAQPIKNILKKLTQIENNINKLQSKVAEINTPKEHTKSQTKPMVISELEQKTLINILGNFSGEIIGYKKLLDPVLENISVTQEKFNSIKSKLELYTEHKEETKLTKQVNQFSNKLQIGEYIEANNYITLLKELKNLENLINNLNIINPAILVQYDSELKTNLNSTDETSTSSLDPIATNSQLTTYSNNLIMQ